MNVIPLALTYNINLHRHYFIKKADQVYWCCPNNRAPANGSSRVIHECTQMRLLTESKTWMGVDLKFFAASCYPEVILIGCINAETIFAIHGSCGHLCHQYQLDTFLAWKQLQSQKWPIIPSCRLPHWLYLALWHKAYFSWCWHEDMRHQQYL